MVLACTYLLATRDGMGESFSYVCMYMFIFLSLFLSFVHNVFECDTFHFLPCSFSFAYLLFSIIFLPSLLPSHFIPSFLPPFSPVRSSFPNMTLSLSLSPPSEIESVSELAPTPPPRTRRPGSRSSITSESSALGTYRLHRPSSYLPQPLSLILIPHLSPTHPP